MANKKQISKISNITLDDYLISVLTKTHTIELDNSGNKNDIYEKMINYSKSLISFLDEKIILKNE